MNIVGVGGLFLEEGWFGGLPWKICEIIVNNGELKKMLLNF